MANHPNRGNAAPVLIRQGDVLLSRIDRLPEGLTKCEGPVILEYGEVTGHKHQVFGGAVMFRADEGRGTQYLLVGDADVEVRHEEHSTARLDAGTAWERLPQSQYTPQKIQRVVD